MPSQAELKAELRKIMKRPENIHCVDCGDKRPTWASLIVPPPQAAFSEPLGCFCCYHCSGAHRRMGTHICFVRSTDLDEWKQKEVEAMRNGGNDMINLVFEALLTDSQKTVVKPNKHTELDDRSNFIYDKYQHRKYYDIVKSRLKSTFERPEAQELAFAGEFDDFFAARTQDAFEKDWHGPANGAVADDVFLSPKSNQKMDRASILESLIRMNSQRQMMNGNDKAEVDTKDVFPSAKRLSKSILDLGDTSPFVINEEDIFNNSTSKMSMSEWSNRSSSSNKPERRGPRGGRGHLMATLERMDSKREVMDSLKSLARDVENENLKPKEVLQGNRRRKSSQTESRRRGNGDSDSKSPHPRSREKSRSASSSSRRKPPDRTPSDGRRVRRSGSSDSADLSREKRESGSRREPSRGVERSKSLDLDDMSKETVKLRQRPRTEKRVVRRAASSGEALSHSSNSFGLSSTSFGEDSSQASSRRKPPRRVPKGDGESVSSRKSRDDDVSRASTDSRRKRSPKREEKSRTPSPDGFDDPRRPKSERRFKSSSKKSDGNPISVSRVPTAPKSARNLRTSSPFMRKKTVENKVPGALGQLFASDD